ncbi:MAG: glycosyl hydrolase family 65 protein [Ginsengibacter sp.]
MKVGKKRLGKNGLFWQEDGQDGMEVSICGTGEENNAGYRATINSYMYADAMAIAKIAVVAGRKDIETRFVSQALNIKKNIQQKVWDQQAEFFKVLSRDTTRQLCDTRELHGYTPWYFSLPDERHSAAWKFLMDPTYFYAPYGPTTAEQKSPGFSISYTGHECQWNGPSWPFATSLTLTAMANLLNDYHQKYVNRKYYLTLLEVYSKSHSITKDSGKQIPWIDENLSPFTGDWISRTRLKTYAQGTWSAEKGGIERGKDYNYSTYCDLIITGLVGLRPQSGDTFIVNPLLPDHKWEYFCLDNVLYHGKIITIISDKKGTHYNKGKGLFVFVDGSKAAASPSLAKLSVKL